MSKAKYQHYVPRFLLRNFSNDGEKIWIHERGQKYRYSKIGIIFKKRHIYTAHKLDNLQMNGPPGSFVNLIGKDYKYDEMIQGLESIAAPIVNHVIERARKIVCPQLCNVKSDTLKRFIFLMARRTPESQERVAASQRQMLRESIPGLLAKALRIDDVTNDQQKQIRLVANYLISNSDARFAAGDMQNVRDEEDRFCRETGIRIVVIRKSKKRFIIGSHGLAIVTKEYESDPSSSSWLPIAHDVAVGLTLSPEKEVLGILNDNEEGNRLIDRVNSASAKSVVIAARSRKDLGPYV